VLELTASPGQRKFGQDKRDALTAQGRNWKVRNGCNGGRPKHRFALSRDRAPGHNCLCARLEPGFTHAGATFNVNLQLLRPRQQVSRLPWRQGAALAVQRGRQRHGGARRKW
jgi:uncharacterized protein